MATYFEIELDRLKKKLIHLGTMVEESLYRAIRAFADRHEAEAIAVIEHDLNIDRMEVELEEDCLKILALYQPVARDLRMIVSVLKINNDIERIADLAANIAERVVFLCRREPIDPPYDVFDMASNVQVMVRKSLDALIELRADLAHEVCATDDHIDQINRETYTIVTQAIQENPEHLEMLLNYISISRYLERIADHATNIAEDVIGLLEGEIVRHRLEEFPHEGGD